MKGAGGDKYSIPQYKEPLNNPMIPNEQKRIYHENKSREPIQNPNQVLNLQLYQPPRPKPGAGAYPNPAVFYPNYVPNPFDPIGYAHYLQHSQYYGSQPGPVFKEYNININGVSGSHVRTSVLFEDALPGKNVAGTFSSVGERVTMYEAIRAILFSSGDGQDMPIDSDSYNLLSHLKLMDMNPYNASRFSANPYKGLPLGFLLYRSCYPIRHDARNAMAICSNNSTGINVRLYMLTDGAYLINRQPVTKASDYDVWRDMAFYNYIKEEILKKKVCPNFPLMYGYNIALNSGINYEELKMVQQRGRVTDRPLNPIGNNSSAPRVGQNGQVFHNRPVGNLPLPPNQTVPIGNVTGGVQAQDQHTSGRERAIIATVRDRRTGIVTQQLVNPPSKDEQAKSLNVYTGKTLVCLTEAPNYSIIGWAKKEYRTDGNIKRMINPGFHPKNVWESVIFQMLVALYVMQIKGIVINDFRPERNVFIKDISTGGNVTSYWKYKIEGVEYYVPNYGYLVIIDSNYRDFDKDCKDEEDDPSRPRKIDGGFLEACKLSIDECIKKTFEMFKAAVDRNIFGQDFVNDNGVKPPEEILGLLSGIRNEADSKPTLNIAYYIRKYMTMFFNNRVGTPLAETEVNNVKKGAIKQFRKGQMVVMADQNGVDRFVVHVKTRQGNTARVITRDSLDPNNSNIIEKDVPVSSLNEYSVVEPIKQTFKMNESNLNEEALLETYNVE